MKGKPSKGSFDSMAREALKGLTEKTKMVGFEYGEFRVEFHDSLLGLPMKLKDHEGGLVFAELYFKEEERISWTEFRIEEIRKRRRERASAEEVSRI